LCCYLPGDSEVNLLAPLLAIGSSVPRQNIAGKLEKKEVNRKDLGIPHIR
jgi:hypothetical protein